MYYLQKASILIPNTKELYIKLKERDNIREFGLTTGINNSGIIS